MGSVALALPGAGCRPCTGRARFCSHATWVRSSHLKRPLLNPWQSAVVCMGKDESSHEAPCCCYGTRVLSMCLCVMQPADRCMGGMARGSTACCTQQSQAPIRHCPLEQQRTQQSVGSMARSTGAAPRQAACPAARCCLFQTQCPGHCLEGMACSCSRWCARA